MSSSNDGNAKRIVIGLVAAIVAGSLAWGLGTIWLSGRVDPFDARRAAERAERECILQGVAPSRCRRLVGRYHQSCTPDGGFAPDAGAGTSRYLDCMTAHFARSDPEPAPRSPDRPEGGPSRDATD